MLPDTTLPEITAALPDRPIRVRPPQTVGLASAAGLFTMLFGLLAGVLWWLGPDLVNDWRMDRDVIEARAGEATLGDARFCNPILAVKHRPFFGPWFSFFV